MKDSPYLFATPYGERPYRGTDVMRSLSIEDKVRNLSVFTSTNLRKHVSTIAQTMEITENEQGQLAEFMGHDIQIHRSSL